MGTTTTLTTNEAKIILDWDDGKWYISDWAYSTDIVPKNTTISTSTTTASSTGGVKVPEWDQSYKYNKNDIVAYSGILYVSKQNQNQNNAPNNGTFWWNNIINLSAVDAITLEGKNIKDITKDILGGNVIGDYYKKVEVESLLLDASNSVNAKRLSNYTLDDIKKDYNTAIDTAKTAANNYTVAYLNNSADDSFDKSLVTLFESIIVSDNVNQI